MMGKKRSANFRNAWKGPRTRPSPEEIKSMANGYEFVPEEVPGQTKHLSALMGPDRFVEIDSVGGTVLFSRSEVFRKGINFPPYYVIGAEWELSEGWDGIETEGLCYVARANGFKCWAMPNDFVDHA
jgi:Anp1